MINNDILYVNVEIACKIGLNEALMLQYLLFLQRYNEQNQNETAYFNGKYYVYHTLEGFTKIFRFWTSRQVRYALESLKAMGIIEVEHLNANKFNRINYYHIVYDKLAAIVGFNPSINVVNKPKEHRKPIIVKNKVVKPCPEWALNYVDKLDQVPNEEPIDPKNLKSFFK